MCSLLFVLIVCFSAVSLGNSPSYYQNTNSAVNYPQSSPALPEAGHHVQPAIWTSNYNPALLNDRTHAGSLVLSNRLNLSDLCSLISNQLSMQIRLQSISHTRRRVIVCLSCHQLISSHTEEKEARRRR